MEDLNEKMIKNLSNAALYEQLAEEATELAHACLKKARKLRKENPTPMENSEIDKKIQEEFTDVCLCSDMLDLNVSNRVYASKKIRWANRLKNA